MEPWSNGEVIDWLMAGDPVIRWQTMRDLLDSPLSEWSKERERVPEEGWGAQFLAAQCSDGSWPSGRWTGTVWTLLVLMDCGISPDHPAMQRAARHELDRHFADAHQLTADDLVKKVDLCHVGFWLRYTSYCCPDDPRNQVLIEAILSQPLGDGGWNCRRRTYPKTTHGSFHTTFNVLEGLREAERRGALDQKVFRDAEGKALEFMLAHRMFRSDKTGEVIDPRFLHLTFPSHWHYTVLRGLDYMRETPEIKDARLDDAISELESRRKGSGKWVVEKRIAGTTLFEMEKMGSESRWNTLRALRVLKARHA